jgi:molecular chaperone GrpE
MGTLEHFDVRPITALGQRFDPNQHEAIMEVEDPSDAPGTVIRVVEEGYMINDRLLRPARVIVSKRGTSEVDDGEDTRPIPAPQHQQ